MDIRLGTLKLCISVMCLCWLLLTNVFPDKVTKLKDILTVVVDSESALWDKVDELRLVQINIEVSYNSISFYMKVVYIQSDLLLKVNFC